MNVYVVTRGDYSDTRIIGVLSSADAALTLIQNDERGRGWHESYYVQIWELDGAEVDSEYKTWAVALDAKTGDVRRVEGWPAGPDGERLAMEAMRAFERENRYQYGWTFTCWARNPQEAVKIASEYRTRRLVEEANKCR